MWGRAGGRVKKSWEINPGGYHVILKEFLDCRKFIHLIKFSLVNHSTLFFFLNITPLYWWVIYCFYFSLSGKRPRKHQTKAHASWHARIDGGDKDGQKFHNVWSRNPKDDWTITLRVSVFPGTLLHFKQRLSKGARNWLVSFSSPCFQRCPVRRFAFETVRGGIRCPQCVLPKTFRNLILTNFYIQWIHKKPNKS